jgi:RNA polymerase sigma-70 factor (ECF subfamily)
LIARRSRFVTGPVTNAVARAISTSEAHDHDMRPPIRTSDEELLGSDDPEAFGMFYDRHVKSLLGFFARRTGNPEVAADLTAETFASAIVARRRYVAGEAPAVAWLFTIARRRLADYHRRGDVEDRARREVAMERRRLSAEDKDMIRLLAEDAAGALLAGLPADQRAAVAGHVVDERGYPELARELRAPEATIRQRVSRGLATLRRGSEGRA